MEGLKEKPKKKSSLKRVQDQAEILQGPIPLPPSLEELGFPVDEPEVLIPESPNIEPSNEVQNEISEASIDLNSQFEDSCVIDSVNPFLPDEVALQTRQIKEDIVDQIEEVEISAPDFELEPCEEALVFDQAKEATAPLSTSESVEFYSVAQSKSEFTNILETNRNILNTLQEEESELYVNPKERPVTPNTQISSLYSNLLLERNEEKIGEFIITIKELSFNGFELYELLCNYLRACNQLIASEKSKASSFALFTEDEKNIWTMQMSTLTQNATCDDKNYVVATQNVHTANFNKDIFTNLTRTLSEIRELVKDSFSLFTYSVQLSKNQIDHFFFKSFNNINLQTFQVQSYASNYPNREISDCAALLRNCISTLFSFVRKVELSHTRFLEDCKDWLKRSISLLLRIAKIDDHIFILNHIIRCPQGSIAKWGSPLLQIPTIQPCIDEYSFGHLHLDYALAFLDTILSAVPQREEFLAQILPPSHLRIPSESNWVVVDSDGEDDFDDIALFKENDLVALLHQVPFDAIFRRILFIRRVGEEDFYDVKLSSENSIFKLLAFSTQLVQILGKAFVTYESERFRQLVKLVGRLILHTALYVTDHIENYLEEISPSGPNLNRILAEYDIFLLNVARALSEGKYIGSLQFLAALPFHLTSSDMIWKIYCLISKWDYYDESSKEIIELAHGFIEEITCMSESDAFYVLTTIANMAIAREHKNENIDFIRVVTVHLFNIGFINPLTRDNCSKNARDLLSNITLKYPQLITTIIYDMKDKINIIEKMSFFLLKELSYEKWKPKNKDIKILSHWLLNFQPMSLENQIARFIFQSVNWDFDDTDELFLPYETHCRVAILVLESYFKWEKSTNFFSESVKQVSSIANRSQEGNFTTWAWEMLQRLHLHGFDRNNNVNEIDMTDIVQELFSFESRSELEPLRKLTDEKSPIGCFATLLLTPIGHSIPILCTTGFDLLEIIIQNSKFEIVINLLFYIVPLFIGDSGAIAKNEKFKNIMTLLMAADKTYVRMAKNLITTDSPGYYTDIFGDMLLAQLYFASRFKTTETKLLKIWIQILTLIENWNKDNNILYLFEVLARFSFTRPECSDIFSEKLKTLYKEMPVVAQGGLASFFNWTTAATTLLSNPSYPNFPYFVYYVFNVEMELENTSGFWKSLCISLQNPKTSIESAVKKASNCSKHITSVNYLTIYRWAQQALDLPINHRLELVFWQNFFLRFLHRVASNDMCRNGVGERFFEGLINQSFVKKIKKRLHDIVNFYQKELSNLENKDDFETSVNLDWLIDFYTNQNKLVNAFALWIEDPNLHQDSLYLPNLPPQFIPNKLLSFIEGELGEWQDLVDTDEINMHSRNGARNFLNFIKRLYWSDPKKVRLTSRISGLNKSEEILKRITTYDKPLDAPPVPIYHQILPIPSYQMFHDVNALAAGVKHHFKILLDYSQEFSLQISQHTSLDCAYLEYLPDLYSNIEAQRMVNVQCSGTKKWKSCTGPAHVVFKFKEAKLNERNGLLIQQNRAEYNQITIKGLQPPPSSVCISAVYLEDIITTLTMEYRRESSQPVKTENLEKLKHCGIELFYMVVSFLNEETNFYPPTRQLFSSFLEILGQEFLANEKNQCQRLVRTCISNPTLVGSLTPHMNFTNEDTKQILSIYQDIITGIPKKDVDLTFVILSKLDISTWLNTKNPRLCERSQLIGLIWKAITSEGLSPDSSHMMVHGRFRSHLKILLLHDFPQHFGEILNHLLDGSEKHCVVLDCWYDFFNALSCDTIKFSAGMESDHRTREMKRFITEIDILHHDILIETAKMLAGHFTRERLIHGIYGLYPKYRSYIEPLSSLILLISYNLLASSLRNSNGSLAQKVIEEVWPLLRNLYSPWILPYDQRTIQQQGAQWVQQLNLDNSTTFQPWIPTDAPLAMTFMNDFTDCVLFLAETLPGSSILYSSLWNFYVENYANLSVKDHVLNIVHKCFVSISWSSFWPNLNDVELMNKVAEKYLPACHSFQSVMFAQINWIAWLDHFSTGSYLAYSSRYHAIILNLTVRFASEIVAKESPTWASVMENFEKVDWLSIISASLEPILNWFVMSIDFRVVLKLDSIHHMDKSSLKLLKFASGYLNSRDTIDYTSPTSQNNKPDINKKRYLFVRSYVRLIIQSSTKFKDSLVTHQKNFEYAVQDMICDISSVIAKEDQTFQDFAPHLKELLSLMANNYLGTISRNALVEWCEGLKGSIPLPLLYAIIHLSFNVKAPPYVAVHLIETAINLAFNQKETSWNSIFEILPNSLDQAELNNYFEISCKDGHYLVLYGLLLKRFYFLCHGELTTTSFLNEILKHLKPKESNEMVLPLLYGIFIKICIQVNFEAEKDKRPNLKKCVQKFLNSLAQHLSYVGEDKQSWSLLGALGLSRYSEVSIRGRIFARSLTTFLLAQLPANGDIRDRGECEGHFNTVSNGGLKPHAEMHISIEKLEGLKQNKLCGDFIEVMDFAMKSVMDPTESLSTCDNFIEKISIHLFPDSSYLFGKRILLL